LLLPRRNHEDLRISYQKNTIGEFPEDVNKKIPFTSSAGEQISAFPIAGTLVAMSEQRGAGLLRAQSEWA
jgi:hypothetical protein